MSLQKVHEVHVHVLGSGIRFGSFPSAEPAPRVTSLLSCDGFTCMGGWMSSFYLRLRSDQVACLSRFRLLSTIDSYSTFERLQIHVHVGSLA